MFACNYLFPDLVSTEKAIKIQEIEHRLAEAIRDNNNKVINECYSDNSDIEKRFRVRRIYVQYYHPVHDKRARSVLLEDEIMIELPIELGKACLPTNGIYPAIHIQRLREITAHEMGHAMLHLEQIPDGYSGTNKLTKLHDKEADFFSECLLKLRNDRRKQLINQKAYLISG